MLCSLIAEIQCFAHKSDCKGHQRSNLRWLHIKKTLHGLWKLCAKFHTFFKKCTICSFLLAMLLYYMHLVKYLPISMLTTAVGRTKIDFLCTTLCGVYSLVYMMRSLSLFFLLATQSSHQTGGLGY